VHHLFVSGLYFRCLKIIAVNNSPAPCAVLPETVLCNKNSNIVFASITCVKSINVLIGIFIPK
jgi:hypothetical protein